MKKRFVGLIMVVLAMVMFLGCGDAENIKFDINVSVVSLDGPGIIPINILPDQELLVPCSWSLEILTFERVLKVPGKLLLPYVGLSKFPVELEFLPLENRLKYRIDGIIVFDSPIDKAIFEQAVQIAYKILKKKTGL